MKISDVILRLENYAPAYLAEDYDNVGLMAGDADANFKAALLTLDVDINVAEEAKRRGANLIISHHPLIFEPLNKITSETAQGRCLLYLIKNGIAVCSAHTNLDSAAGGFVWNNPGLVIGGSDQNDGKTTGDPDPFVTQPKRMF